MYILEVFHVHMITYMYVHTRGISCTHDYIYVCTYWRYFIIDKTSIASETMTRKIPNKRRM